MRADARRRACPVCGGDDKRLLFRQRFGGGLEGTLFPGYDVIVCALCGFAFADDLPPQTAFDEYYTEMSKYEAPHRDGRHDAFTDMRYQAATSFIASRS